MVYLFIHGTIKHGYIKSLLFENLFDLKMYLYKNFNNYLIKNIIEMLILYPESEKLYIDDDIKYIEVKIKY